MMFLETFPIFYSIGLVIAVSSIVFVWRFLLFKRKSIASLVSLPSIIVTGPKLSGKTSLIKSMSGNEISIHPFEDGLPITYLKYENQTLQFIEVSPFVNGSLDNLQRLKKLNLKSLIYIFDVSKTSDSIENQLENFEKIKKLFNRIPYIVVVNKIDIAEKEKKEKLRRRFEKIYETCLLDEKINYRKSLPLKKEFEDVNYLIQDLLREIEVEGELKTNSKYSL